MFFNLFIIALMARIHISSAQVRKLTKLSLMDRHHENITYTAYFNLTILILIFNPGTAKYRREPAWIV